MNGVTIQHAHLPAMSDASVKRIRSIESALGRMDQVEMPTHHVLHGGMYARTIIIPAGVAITGALIKVPTTLVIDGRVSVHLGDTTLDLVGHHVIPASAGRKQVFFAYEDTSLTMIMATGAATIEDAEAEFTDEADRLMSRQQGAENFIIITGE